MIIYGDILFVENLIIGGVLLYLTGEICGYNVRRNGELFYQKLRFVFGSIMCGGFSLVIFPELNMPTVAKSASMLLMEVVFAVTVCIVVFGCKRNSELKCSSLLQLPWHHVIVFILTTYFMGGIVMGLLLITKQQGIYTAVGIYSGDLKAGLLAVFICFGYITAKQIIKTVRNRKMFTEHSYEVEITIGEHIFKASAFLDTGNRLKDPMTGKPVGVASEALWERICSDGQKKAEHRFALVPYEAVGARGLLEAVRTDHIQIGSRKINRCLIARGERKFLTDLGAGDDKGNGYDLLISGEMVENILRGN